MRGERERARLLQQPRDERRLKAFLAVAKRAEARGEEMPGWEHLLIVVVAHCIVATETCGSIFEK